MIQIEEMSLNAWPAIKSAFHKGCILRTSAGYTNRANSANPLYSAKGDFDNVIRYAEKFYGRIQSPCVFKILNTERYEALDAQLEGRGYETISRTTVMKCDLRNFTETEGERVTIERTFSEKWLSAFISHNKIREEDAGTAWTMLNLIAVDVIVGSIAIDGNIGACGYGAVENGYVGFFDIVVDERLRGNGLGRTLMNGIIAEAKRRDAHTGYLQVLEGNAIAKNLYESLGFNDFYKYWYRKKEFHE